MSSKPHWITCRDCGFVGLGKIPHICEPDTPSILAMKIAQRITQKYPDLDIFETSRILHAEIIRYQLKPGG
jgi:hypothetical protein